MPHIYHTALTVSNLDRSQKFYEAVFDFKPVSEGERPEMGLKFVVLKDSHGGHLELLAFDDTKPQDQEAAEDFNTIGIKHLAFWVEDMDEIYQKAIDHGASVFWPIKEGVHIKRIAILRDPDGIMIELSEPR